jgi:hypothetical protein
VSTYSVFGKPGPTNPGGSGPQPLIGSPTSKRGGSGRPSAPAGRRRGPARRETAARPRGRGVAIAGGGEVAQVGLTVHIARRTGLERWWHLEDTPLAVCHCGLPLLPGRRARAGRRRTHSKRGLRKMDFEALLSKIDMMPPLWPSGPKWPTDDRLLDQLLSEPPLSQLGGGGGMMKMMLGAAKDQRVSDERWRHFKCADHPPSTRWVPS